ncbi:pentatricopeptide repeat-containing protein At2g20710, mitochondrial-like [Chenopodium quinoa]|uniref:Pentatricopeptide repeat-containing protein n=1 Tax=Chenopodium quinoa TaxID=63459 RepID=A0A803MWC2_CHEQI|nr:pentatricopeptide repeat-containing protein At2g20710, mitochondrial-like [Chenopodium quinoa]
MKLCRLISRTSSFSLRKVCSGLNWYSTQGNKGLYRRIFPLGKPCESPPSILDQWIQEGLPVTQNELRVIIKQLRHFRHYQYALEVSKWMSDKRYMHLLIGDVAIRLDLIAKVHGIEAAEYYFNNTPKQMRTVEVYGALLNCYAHAKCVDKADAVMHKMREFGSAVSTVNYNAMLNVYYQTGNYEKADALICEMESKHITFDKVTYGILLHNSGADSDVEEIEKVLTRIESHTESNISWKTYADAANQFLKVGYADKALESLRKSEKLILLEKNKNKAFSCLLTLYATAGNKEEVLRTWNERKKFMVVYNRDYICILSSILKFDDIETAENIFKEWKASDLNKDIRTPNLLISFYCRNGLVEKAEALIENVNLENWEKPNASTLFWMSLGYFQRNQMQKAVEAMQSALLKFKAGSNWKLNKENTVACLKYLKDEGDVDRSGEFVSLLKDKGFISEEGSHQLLAYFSDKYAFDDESLASVLDGNEDCIKVLN